MLGTYIGIDRGQSDHTGQLTPGLLQVMAVAACVCLLWRHALIMHRWLGHHEGRQPIFAGAVSSLAASLCKSIQSRRRRAVTRK